MKFDLKIDFINNPIPFNFTIHPYQLDGNFLNYEEQTNDHLKCVILSSSFGDILSIRYQECNTGKSTNEFLLSNIHFSGNRSMFAKWYREHLVNTEIGKALVESRFDLEDRYEPYPWETRTDTALRFSKIFHPTFEQKQYITELKRTLAYKLLNEPICMFKYVNGDIEYLHHDDHPNTIIWNDIYCTKDRKDFYELLIKSYQLKGEILEMFD